MGGVQRVEDPPGTNNKKAFVFYSNSPNMISPKGFTLIELIVVVSLIGIMLFFSIPRFQGAVLEDNLKYVSRRIIRTIRSLKEASVRDQRRYVLHVNIDTNSLWVTHEAMSEEELENAERGGFELPEDIRVTDVEYAEKGKVSFGRADIHFYKENYSDRALMHIEDDDGNQHSFLIETFLSNVKFQERYMEFGE